MLRVEFNDFKEDWQMEENHDKYQHWIGGEGQNIDRKGKFIIVY